MRCGNRRITTSPVISRKGKEEFKDDKQHRCFTTPKYMRRMMVAPIQLLMYDRHFRIGANRESHELIFSVSPGRTNMRSNPAFSHYKRQVTGCSYLPGIQPSRLRTKQVLRAIFPLIGRRASFVFQARPHTVFESIQTPTHTDIAQSNDAPRAQSVPSTGQAWSSGTWAC